jgi:glutamine amidotransferase
VKVGIIDYGVGNLASVKKALEEIGVNTLVIDQARQMGCADKYILPGVGNFTNCKQCLDKSGWTEAISEEVLGRKRPLLGICVGMQLLADTSTEGAATYGSTAGLGFISGEVVAIKSLGCQYRIPHMGWNSIKIIHNCPLLQGVDEGTDFYFVHSYTFISKMENAVQAQVEYDVTLSAVVGKDHIWGTQFHPEKSSLAGSKILSNFVLNIC